MPQKRDFTMQRGDRMERTVVGIDGQTHVMDGQRRPLHRRGSVPPRH